MKKFILIFMFFSAFLFAKENISNLLSDFAQKADLSNQTKQESAGFLTVYTRQDLDRMQIHYLKDIIEKIPFLRYNEDSAGLTNPFYIPYQPTPTDAIKVYINDRELITPFNGNALKLFGQMSIGFIDHIEIYMGVPAQTLGIQPGWIVIKCYTKNPKRENTNLLGVRFGSYGTKETYGYSAKNLTNFSYLVYLNNRNLKREQINYKNTTLSKNKNITNFYGQIQKNNLRFEIQASKGSMENFMGQSINIDPKSTYTKYNYLYMGIYYKNKENDLKAFINFSQDKTNHFDSSKTILGIFKIPVSPFIYTYQDSHIQMKEQVSDAQIYKIYKTHKNKFVLGLHSRYKHFHINEMRFGNKYIKNSANYNKELILSGFLENNFMINDSNMITASLKFDKSFENAEVKDYSLFSGRIGYIFNNGKLSSKTYIFTGETTPSMQTLFLNRVFYHQTDDPKKERSTAFATKFIYKTKNHTTSILLGHTISKNSLYFDGTGYKNDQNNHIVDTISLRHIYSLDALNKIIFNGWIDASHKQGISINNASKYYGGLITFLNSVGKFDFYNNLIYKHWSGIKNAGYNLNSAVTYHRSRKLTFFIKAENILDKALKSNYYRINPLTHSTNYLNNIDSIDRRFWIGMEYQF